MHINIQNTSNKMLWFFSVIKKWFLVKCYQCLEKEKLSSSEFRESGDVFQKNWYF